MDYEGQKKAIFPKLKGIFAAAREEHDRRRATLMRIAEDGARRVR